MQSPEKIHALRSVNFHTVAALFSALLLFAACRDLPVEMVAADSEMNTASAPPVLSSAGYSGFSDPKQRFEELTAWIDEVRSLPAAEIEEMPPSELRAFAGPLIHLNENSVALPEFTLMAVRESISQISESAENISYRRYQLLSEGILDKIYPPAFSLERGLNDHQGRREFSTEQLRNMLLEIQKNESTGYTCDSLFNRSGEFVLLLEGDHLNGANLLCPESTTFALIEGHFQKQSVTGSKAGNRWIGIGDAVLDGALIVERAFEGGMNRNLVFGIEVRNYSLHGIYSRSDTHHLTIRNVSFHTISPDSNGQEYGAVQFDFSSHISVLDSRFKNVASGIRFGHSQGPIQALRNEAVNSGRNFFQCNQCTGNGIRVNGNSLQREWQFGVDPLEDWINIHLSSGTPDDYIQVNNNRARGRSSSESGSFILLGDEGGAYQEAIGNIGVNPGEIGIGIAGGESIRVKRNQMYSHASSEGNVAYYSVGFVTPCGSHTFSDPDSPDVNRALWQRSNGSMNRAWADGKCGISNREINSKIVEDTLLNPSIWHQWNGQLMDRSQGASRRTGPDPRTLPGLY